MEVSYQLFFFFLYTNLTAFIHFDLSNHKLRIDSLVLHYLLSIKKILHVSSS